MKHYTVCGEEIGRVIGGGNFEEMVKAGFFEKIKANNPDETGDFGDYAFSKMECISLASMLLMLLLSK